MKLKLNTFLYSYMFFLGYSIFYNFMFPESAYINYLMLAISIASAFIAIAELFYSKASIDIEIYESYLNIYKLYKMKAEQLEEGLMQDYGDEAKLKIVELEKCLGENELQLLYSGGNESTKVKEIIVEKLLGSNSDNKTELILDAISLIDHMHSTEDELLNNEDKQIEKLINQKIQKEKSNQLISNIIAIIGFFMLLVFLTLEKANIVNINLYNNILTSVAFLSVLVNITMKEDYRRKSYNEINQYKIELENIMESK